MDLLNSRSIKTAFKRTRRGKVIRSVTECYLRDDLKLGYLHNEPLDIVKFTDLLSQYSTNPVVLVDTNIIIHHMDILEARSPATSIIIIPQTAFNEVKHINTSLYKRLVTLLNDTDRNYIFIPNEFLTGVYCKRHKTESINDYNDKLIVRTGIFLKNTLPNLDNFIFVTNDNQNKKNALEVGLVSYDIYEFTNKYSEESPFLLELLSSNGPSTINVETVYSEYYSKEAIADGLRNGKLFKGIMRPKNDKWDDCYVTLQQTETRKIVHIQGKENVNRALDGDIVVIEILPDIAKVIKPEASSLEDLEYQQIEGVISNNSFVYGKVVGIQKRNAKKYCGSIEIVSNTNTDNVVLFRPVDKRVPPIWINTHRASEISDMRLQVSIDHWPVSSNYPCGHYTKVLGKYGDKLVETQIILQEYGVTDEQFSDAVLSCLPSTDWQIPEEEVKLRSDFRGLPIVSIDPPGCKDIDDALHCIRISEGRYQVGVHIADVTHFVHPNTPLDKEAAFRSTSTYLVERRLDMLPSLLTTELCSLRSSEDHIAFSVLWEMDEDANIYDVQFSKSVIRSVASLTYDQAQTILDGPGTSAQDMSVKYLGKLARILKKKRIENGALTLASPEIRFKFDEETNDPSELLVYALKEANSLVEEWMLLANITVSKKILKHFPTLGILRRHQAPSREQFLPLIAASKAAGVSIDITTSKTLADSLDEAVREDDPYFNKLLRMLSTRCMMPAQYFCSGEIPKDQWHHYGLATQVYTHFTSPIRRYADVLVHRLLAAAIGVIPLPTSNSNRKNQQELCSHMNRRHRAAQYAQRASVQINTILYFKNRNCIEDGYVIAINEKSLRLIIPNFGIEEEISVEETYAFCKATSHTFDSEELTINYLSNDQKVSYLHILDKVTIRIEVIEGESSADLKLHLVSKK